MLLIGIPFLFLSFKKCRQVWEIPDEKKNYEYDYATFFVSKQRKIEQKITEKFAEKVVQKIVKKKKIGKNYGNVCISW